MMIKKYLYFVICVFSTLTISSQSNIPLGYWKSHLSYKTGIKVAKTKDKVVYASSRGLISIDQEDLSVKFLSKEDGLSDVIVSNLYYDDKSDKMIIVYSDNNIDILNGDHVTNIPFIQTNTSVLGSKTINDIFIKDHIAYMATDFGVLGFDLDALEFTFTTFTTEKIQCISVINNKVYVGTEQGIYNIAIKGSNVSDFYSWKPLDNDPKDVSEMAVFADKAYFLAGNKVYSLDSSDNISVAFQLQNAEEGIKFISEDGSTLMIGVVKGDAGRMVFLDNNGQMTEKGYGCVQRLQDAVEDKKGRVWYADEWDPIIYTESKTGDCRYLRFSVPFDNDASGIRFKKDKAYFGSNGVNEDFDYKYSRNGYYVLQDNEWTNFSPENFKPLFDYEFFHLKTLAPHPKTDEIYLGSYYNGILYYNELTNEVKHWNKNNSILQAVTGDSTRTRISGLTFDKNENLWISNYGAPKPLAVKTKDNTWHNFSVPGSTNLNEIVIDQSGNKWIAVFGVGNGVVVYNEGSKIADPTDDKVRSITRTNSEIVGNKVNCVMVDLDGSVWVGTDQGPVIFDCGDPFSETCRGTTRKVVVEGIPAPLLRYEDIISMAVDGANRKWFGTRNGIFVQSPDGVTEVARYTSKNSPLLDNTVRTLAYNGYTGEMFIVTPGGIQSFKTETTSGGNSHSSSVVAFPNPVRPDYTGPIAIKGLVRDANVKITDINGKLVYETKALGGQAIWDGMDYNGARAATGVYLVFSANENTSLPSDALVTKILIVR